MITMKGNFTYSWFNDATKLNHVGLPPIGDFYNDLKEEAMNPSDYEHSLNVYNTFKCTTFRDYHDLYLKMDALLLMDIFENLDLKCMVLIQLTTWVPLIWRVMP